MRIAVVGAGVAGMSAAWALSKKHDVVLFEKESVAGGHARTIDVPCGSQTASADIGFLIFHPWHYSNFAALLGHLGVRTRPVTGGVTISADFADGSRWQHGLTTDVSDRFQDETIRFQDLMRQTVADPAASFGQTLGEFLAHQELSREFQEKFVVPLLSMLFVTRFGVLDVGLLNAAICFGPVPMLNLRGTMPFETVEGGSREYVKRLIQEIAEVRLGCCVERIERNTQGARLHVEGEVQSFDHVVLATDAHTALRMLDNPTPHERQLLGDVGYEPCRMVVHTDRTVMPQVADEWAAYSFMSTVQGTYSNYYLRRVQPWIERDVFATTDPPDGLIGDEHVIHRQDNWRHLKGDVLQYLRAAEMHRIQGKCRTWYCGAHVADSAWHEGCLRTGLAVAVALGADYPFADDPAAAAGFYDTAVELMRVLPSRARTVSKAIWPPPVLGLARLLIREQVLSEARDRLRLGLPEPLFHPASPLAWVREAIVRCVAPTISPYQERKKTFRPCDANSSSKAPEEPLPTGDRLPAA